MTSVKTFKDLYNSLKTKTFENICIEYFKSKQQECPVECCGNTAYDDDDLCEFLTELGAKITNYDVEYATIQTNNGHTYELPYEERTNRHGDDLPDETILSFEHNKIKET